MNVVYKSASPDAIRSQRKIIHAVQEVHQPVTDEEGLAKQLQKDVDYKTFFEQAPCIHPNCEKIRGTICGVRIENIEDPLMKQIRYLDKLIDELAKGREMGKILRT